MKSMFFLFASVLSLTTAHAKALTFTDVPRIISLIEISPEKIQEFISSRNPNFVVELKEGNSLPLQFLTKTRVFSALLDPNLTIQVDKTCYLRIVNKKCYMSEDLVKWEKAEKFLNGESTIRFYPSTNKPGFVLESNIVPFREEIEE